MSIDLSKTSLVKFASDILEKDEDKVVTKEEVKKYVSDNETEFISLKIDSNSAVDELSEILSSPEEDEKATTDEKTEDTKSIGAIEHYNKLKEQVANFEQQIEKYNNQIEILNEEAVKLNEQLEEEKTKYSDLEKTLSEENKNYKNIIDKINTATSTMEEDIKHQQKQAVYEAMNEYNPDKNGDWDKFLSDYVSDKNIDSEFKSTVSGLINKSDFVALNLNNLGSKLSKQAEKVNSIGVNLQNTTEAINSFNSMIATTEVALNKTQEELKNSILSLISEEELCLAKEMEINLSEKLCDGSPRYIFAQGDSDSKFHIYDMGQWNENGDNSLVRLKYKYEGPSFNIIECGSGGIIPNSFKDLGKNSTEGREYYYFEDDNTISSSKACYQTWSPLSLDLNGNGVKTSSRIINYDIDGDGVVDKINDSADAVLVFDGDGNGISGEDGSECFGDNTDLSKFGINQKFNNGFEALKALADVAKKEGLIDNDNKLNSDELSKLEERFGLKIKKDGYSSQASSLKDAGIEEINLAQTDKVSLEDNFDNMGNQLMRQNGATFKINGQEHEYADIWHKKQNEAQTQIKEETPSSNFFESYFSALSLDASSAIRKTSSNLNIGEQIKQNSKSTIENLRKNTEANIFTAQKPQTTSDLIQGENEDDEKNKERKKKI